MDGSGGGPSFIFCIIRCKDSSVTSGELLTMSDSGAVADDTPSDSSSAFDSSGVESFSLTENQFVHLLFHQKTGMHLSSVC